jgi:hypothetical protein
MVEMTNSLSTIFYGSINPVSIGIFSGNRERARWATCILCRLCGLIQYVGIPPGAFESQRFV